MTFKLPPSLTTDEGMPRRVGYELEFIGLTLQQTAGLLQTVMGGDLKQESDAEFSLEASLGTFNIELDWDYLKRKASQAKVADEGHDWVEFLRQAATGIVPTEVVCPPIAMEELGALDVMVDALRDAGAKGTEHSPIAAYGVHINPEISRLDAPTLDRYLKAFSLLQWWLVEAHQVDLTRKLSPYVNLYPDAYLEAVLSVSDPDMNTIFSTYLEHNPTRNRALDLLPMLSEVDEDKVRAVVDDPRIKPRPTFHYRLPNCLIEDPAWSLANSWNIWWVVEKLADDQCGLESLSEEFLDRTRLLLGVNRNKWQGRVQRWLRDQGWV